VTRRRGVRHIYIVRCWVLYAWVRMRIAETEFARLCRGGLSRTRGTAEQTAKPPEECAGPGKGQGRLGVGGFWGCGAGRRRCGVPVGTETTRRALAERLYAIPAPRIVTRNTDEPARCGEPVTVRRSPVAGRPETTRYEPRARPARSRRGRKRLTHVHNTQ
jgi:hypothetical protein